MQDLIVRPYQNGDEEAIVNVLKASFPEWSKKNNAIDYWRWKYKDAPLGFFVQIVEIDNKIVGVDHDIKFNIKIGDRILLGKYSDDSATDPEYRGKGIYNKLFQLAEELSSENKIKIHYSVTTNDIIYKNGLKNKRIEFPYLLTHFIKIKDINYHLKKTKHNSSILFNLGTQLLKIMNFIKNTNRYKTNLTDYEVTPIKQFDSRFDVFWNKIKNDYDFILEKNSRYLNWRFNDRSGRYKIKSAVKNGEIIGYIVSEIKNGGDYPEGYILDLLTLKDRPEVAANLLRDACDELNSMNINAIHIKLIKDSRFSDIPERAGFIDISNVSKMKILFMGYDEIADSSKIFASTPSERVHFTISDYL